MKTILICATLLMMDWWGIKATSFQIREGEVYDKTTPRRREKDELDIFSYGSIKAVKKLLDQGFDINKRHPKTGETPLIYACVGRRADIVELLIAKGANVNSKSVYGGTALTSAVYRENVPITKMLLKAGAKVNFHGNRGYTPLMMAVAGETPEAPELVDLLLKAGAKLQLDKLEVTALHIVARFGQIEVGEKLIRLGANLEAQDDRSQDTPLMYAVDMNRLEMVKFLVSKGANVNAVNDSNDTAIGKAISKKNIEIVEFLLKNGAQINRGSLFAAANSDPRILKAILDKTGTDTKALVNIKSKEGYTPLMKAVFYDRTVRSTKNVEMLLAAGADPRVKNIYGADALSYAKEERYRPLIRLLERAIRGYEGGK
jgi:ankyrin repeat protein